MKIAMYDLEGHFLEVFDVETSRELAIYLNISENSLYGCLSGKNISTDFKQFREVCNGHIPLKKLPNAYNTGQGKQGKPVLKYYKGEFISFYNTAEEAELKTGVDATHISKCCKGKRTNAGGFEWKYAN